MNSDASTDNKSDSGKPAVPHVPQSGNTGTGVATAVPLDKIALVVGSIVLVVILLNPPKESTVPYMQTQYGQIYDYMNRSDRIEYGVWLGQIAACVSVTGLAVYLLRGKKLEM